MELLLFLSALLAGLLSVDRPVDGSPVERSAVAAIAAFELGETAVEVASEAIALPNAPSRIALGTSSPKPVLTASEPRPPARVDERRLE